MDDGGKPIVTPGARGDVAALAAGLKWLRSTTMSDEAEPMAHEVTIKYRDRQSAVPFDRMQNGDG
jgi:hypothetical protein